MMRKLPALGLLAMLTVVGPAEAAPVDKRVCADAYEGAQRSQLSGQLQRARASLLTCANDACPATLRNDCVKWLAELEPRIPTIVVQIRRSDGAPTGDGRVLLDGNVIAEHLDGRAVAVDPGEHVVRVERADASPLELRVVVREGAKAQSVELVEPIEVPKPEPASPPAGSVPPPPLEGARPVPWTVWALGGVAAVGLGSFTVFGLTGLSQETSTLDGCRGHCSGSDVDDVRTKYLVADISLGVGIVAAALATVLFVTRPAAETQRVGSR